MIDVPVIRSSFGCDGDELRLLHVAMTRARNELDLIVPQRFHTSQKSGLGDRHEYGNRTSFFPNRLLDRIESLAWPIAISPEDGTPAAAPSCVDLKARMRSMQS